MSTKHTPGPWKVSNRFPAFGCVAIVKHSPDQTLTVDARRRPTSVEWEANARLMAAAPTMLETLELAELWLMEGLLLNALEGDYVIELHRKIKEITHGH